MAKPLGLKSRIIRAAITANPDMGNTKLAEMLNDAHDRLDDKLTFTAIDVASQKQAMKKPGAEQVMPSPVPPASAAPDPASVPAAEPKKRGRPKGSQPAPRKVAPVAEPASPGSPVDLIDGVFDLAEKCGGFGALKRLVDRLAQR